jgi:sterol desaturase/sphingolipid hydroxylase (fatty acid hydroxylase superfamily)
MAFWFAATGLGMGFLYLMVVFVPMERAFPAKRGQGFFRPQWAMDLTFFAGQYLLWGGMVLWCLDMLGDYLDVMLPTGFRALVRSQHWAVQAVEVLLLSDLLIYWAHRLQHSWSFLWRFHKVHHSTEHLDWLAAYREHPLDSVYTVGVINLPAIMMGFPLEMIAGVVAFRGIWAVYIHSNVRMPIGPLRMLIGAPELITGTTTKTAGLATMPIFHH